jgi:hypothetical protein
MDHGGIVSYESNDQFGSSYIIIRPGIHGQLHRPLVIINLRRQGFSVLVSEVGFCSICIYVQKI